MYFVPVSAVWAVKRHTLHEDMYRGLMCQNTALVEGSFWAGTSMILTKKGWQRSGIYLNPHGPDCIITVSWNLKAPIHLCDEVVSSFRQLPGTPTSGQVSWCASARSIHWHPMHAGRTRNTPCLWCEWILCAAPAILTFWSNVDRVDWNGVGGSPWYQHFSKKYTTPDKCMGALTHYGWFYMVLLAYGRSIWIMFALFFQQIRFVCWTESASSENKTHRTTSALFPHKDTMNVCQ